LDNRSLIVLDASVNVIAIGKSMYIIRMSTTAADQYQNIQQFRQPLEDSIIFHFPPASVEGTWTTGVGDDSAFNGAAATPRRWDAALTLTADGHYMYVVEQSKTPVWELRVVGTWAVTDPSPIKSENSGQITLMPTTSQMTGTVDRNYELSRLGYEGFPVDSTESLAISTGGQGGIDLTKLSNSGSRHYDLSTLAPPPAGTLRITDAAAFSTGPVAQGSLISLFGNFGVTQTSATSLPLPTSLSQLSVTVAGRLSPLLFVGASQVNLQLPFETPEGNAQVVVSVRGGAILSGTVAVTRTAPKLFSSDGKHAVVLNEDYTLNSSTNPAKAGSYLIAYITGQGALRTPVASGAAAPSSPPAVTAATTTAMIGGKPANVAFSGGAPGFAGVAQVNVQVPGGLANAVPLTVTVGGAESNALVIYIAP
jgi:uncharacterized protein (TIGR03437 family)